MSATPARRLCRLDEVRSVTQGAFCNKSWPRMALGLSCILATGDTAHKARIGAFAVPPLKFSSEPVYFKVEMRNLNARTKKITRYGILVAIPFAYLPPSSHPYIYLFRLLFESDAYGNTGKSDRKRPMHQHVGLGYETHYKNNCPMCHG